MKGQKFLCLRAAGMARRSKFYASPVSVEEFGPERFLKRCDLLAQRRLRHAQSFGGTRHMQGFTHSEKDLKATKRDG